MQYDNGRYDSFAALNAAISMNCKLVLGGTTVLPYYRGTAIPVPWRSRYYRGTAIPVVLQYHKYRGTILYGTCQQIVISGSAKIFVRKTSVLTE